MSADTALFFVQFNKDKKMKKLLITLSATSLLVLIGTGSSVAQDDGMVVIPVEMYVCSYNEVILTTLLINGTRTWTPMATTATRPGR